MYRGKVKFITQAAVIAALYVVFTLIANMFGMARGIVQVRISEALTILPFFTPAAIPGLFVGCLVANFLTGATMLDVIFGSLATLVGAVGTYFLRKNKYVVAIPPIVVNSIVIPLLFTYVYRFENSFWYFVITIGIGELISCGVLGTALLLGLEDYKDKLFPKD